MTTCMWLFQRANSVFEKSEKALTIRRYYSCSHCRVPALAINYEQLLRAAEAAVSKIPLAKSNCLTIRVLKRYCWRMLERGLSPLPCSLVANQFSISDWVEWFYFHCMEVCDVPSSQIRRSDPRADCADRESRFSQGQPLYKDGFAFLKAVSAPDAPEHLYRLPALSVLRWVWIQQFVRE